MARVTRSPMARRVIVVFSSLRGACEVRGCLGASVVRWRRGVHKNGVTGAEDWQGEAPRLGIGGRCRGWGYRRPNG
jgi:hypothetical protein